MERQMDADARRLEVAPLTHLRSSGFIRGFIHRCDLFARDIKISHSIFAMPWAILAAVMAWDRVGGPIAGKMLLVIVCMVTARTVAMAANRLLDAELDRRNPRTAQRAIPSGQLSV